MLGEQAWLVLSWVGFEFGLDLSAHLSVLVDVWLVEGVL